MTPPPIRTRTADRRSHDRRGGCHRAPGAVRPSGAQVRRPGPAGAAVLRTVDPDETAACLARLYQLEGKGPSQVRGHPRPRRPSQDLRRVAEDVLGCLPGVSTVGARRLLEHFGSLAAVFAADEERLRAVAGVGPRRAAALARLFHDA